MFLSRGNVVEVLTAGKKPLRDVLREYMGRRFSGRVSYRYPAEGVFISIEMVDGAIVACRGVALGSLYEGVKCCEAAIEYLDRSEGSIEVIEIDLNYISNDIRLFPSSKIEGETTLHKHLLQTQVIGRAVGGKPSVEVPEPEASLTPPSTRRGVAISSECIDPLQLYNTLKNSQLVFQTGNPLPHEEVEKILGELMARNPRHIYISSTIKNRPLRILIDVTNAVGYYQLETDGESMCGEEVYREYLQEPLLNTKIWML